jgi:uncharacterized protein (TIGR00661 family)
MKFAFIIQGEGRGHQTQALAMSEMLKSNGHKVVIALVGTISPTKIPILLKEKADFPTIAFQSPTLVYDKKNNGLSIKKTLFQSVLNLNKYIKSLKIINDTLDKYDPDVVLNFYDFLGGIYNALSNKKRHTVCIGHQYLLLNKHFKHPKNNWFEKQVVNLNTHITALGANRKLALSFSAFSNDGNIITVPPLLRSELSVLKVKNEKYILVYLTQPELIQEIVDYAVLNCDVQFEVFIDKIINNIPENVNLNPISSSLFLQKMAKCKAIICTAGFESVCEAMYLSKPTLMVPIKNHYEQLCNATDAQRAGAGLFLDKINVKLFLNYLENQNLQNINHQVWINKAEQLIMAALNLPAETDLKYINSEIEEFCI